MKQPERLVLVRWVDSRGVGREWSLLKDIAKEGVCNVESAGWLLYETDELVCIVPHLAREEDGDHQLCGEMNIPKVAIEAIHDLRKK